MLQDPSTGFEPNQDRVRRLLFRVAKYWYVTIICLTISILAVFIFHRRAQKIYQAEMSLLLKDDQVDENSAALLYENGLMTTRSTLAKDEYLLASYPLIYSVVKKLEFNTSVYKDEYASNNEVYPKLPMKIIVQGGDCLNETPLYFTIISDSTLLFSTPEVEESQRKISFGETIIINRCRLVFYKSSNEILNFKNQRYALVFHDLNATAKQYQNSYTVRAVNEEVNVLQLTVVDGNRKKAVDFLTEISKTYIQNNVKQKNERAERGIKFIKEQLNIVTDSLVRIESLLQHSHEITNSDFVSQQGERLYSRLENLETRQSEIKLMKIYLDTLFNYLKPGKDINNIVIPSAMGLTDPILNSRFIELVNLQVEQKKIAPDNRVNPLYKKLETTIDEEKIRILEVLKNIQKEKEIDQRQIDLELGTVNSNIEKLPIKERQLISIQRQYAATEALYTLLNGKLAEVSITKASSLPDFEIINPPTSTNISIAPQYLRNYILASIIGFVISIGILYLTMLLSTTVETVTDIKRITSVPLLGVVGTLPGDDQVLRRGQRSVVGESFRAIRSKLRNLYGDDQSKIYLITSCFCGEGKTFCSVNLATVHAFSGKKTLLISTDLRKHHNYSGLIPTNSIGLSDYLANPIPLVEIIQPSKIENLFIIGTGKLPDNPSELLATPKATAMLTELRKEFEIIILDTPPLGIISDAMSLIPAADHKILIIRYGYTHKNLLEAVDEMCASNNVNNISIIFNDVRYSKLEGRYGYYYGNIYGYEYKASGKSNRKKEAISV